MTVRKDDLVLSEQAAKLAAEIESIKGEESLRIASKQATLRAKEQKEQKDANDLVIKNQQELQAEVDKANEEKLKKSEQQAAKEAKILAASQGVRINDPMESLQGLHYMKLAIDNQFKNRTASTALQNYSDAALQNTKQSLLGAIEGTDKSIGISPLYGLARGKYAEMSKPINQMEIGQELVSRMTSALRGDKKLNPETFANATTDASNVVQKAGLPRFTALSDALSPANMQTVNNVRDTLANKALADQLAKSGSSQASKLTGTPEIPTINLLNAKATTFNTLVRMLRGKGTSRMDQEMARDMLTDPSQVSKLMRSAMARANTMD
jgi:hypothetical protein